jgi:hypothetical protein
MRFSQPSRGAISHNTRKASSNGKPYVKVPNSSRLRFQVRPFALLEEWRVPNAVLSATYTMVISSFSGYRQATAPSLFVPC